MDTPSPAESRPAANSRLNAAVAVAVAVLGTFMGICKVKDDNIVQAMQQAQADKLDHWSYYQARNVREEVARAALAQLRLQAASAKPEQRADVDAAVRTYQALADEQHAKKDELQKQALADQERYDALNYRDDQFDLSDAAISIAIALLAVASLTDAWWLFGLAMVPAGFGTLMGFAGLAGLPLHPQWLASLLG